VPTTVAAVGGSLLITALAQLGMAAAGGRGASLAMTFLIGAGTASLLAGSSLTLQVGASMGVRGRMAALGQIACLGGGGLSGIVAAALCQWIGLPHTFALLGLLGLGLAMRELLSHRALRLRSDEPPAAPRPPGRQR